MLNALATKNWPHNAPQTADRMKNVTTTKTSKQSAALTPWPASFRPKRPTRKCSEAGGACGFSTFTAITC